MEDEILKFKEKYSIGWEEKLLVAKDAICIKDDIQYIKTKLIGFLYKPNKGNDILLDVRFYGSREEINAQFQEAKADLSRGIYLEVSACPIQYDKWSKAIREFKDQQHEDKMKGIDIMSLEQLEKEL
ncbi:hypothetical protein HOB10_00670 [Candidatus Parcubacteria bacterium]|jgi:hypothetical protein|nr:hypothetical protein [Candidatus Parcubacteria bacterium]